jgi:hypothetical protein
MKYYFEDGKYTVEFNESTGRLSAFRHGQPWRDIQGDGLILAMLQEVDKLCSKNVRCKSPYQTCKIYGYQPTGGQSTVSRPPGNE